MGDLLGPTTREASYCRNILEKDKALRCFLRTGSLSEPVDPNLWLVYLTGIKEALGNINNDISFVATLLVKSYLHKRFAITEFDAAAKPQGAAGVDVEAVTLDGKAIIGEIKTTRPYQPGFGVQQRTTILKDIDRLAHSGADYRYMFVTDPQTYRTLCGQTFSRRAPGIEIVELITGDAFLCRA